MSESTKARNFLNKTKPTIMFEVRKKNSVLLPNVLNKDIEKLFQLSDINVDNNNKNITTTISNEKSTSPSMNVPASTI
jgi:hypothetical protein